MSDARSLKDSFSECIPLFIALGDSTRLNIIQCLYEVSVNGTTSGIPGLNVKEITEQTSLSRPAVSHHLKILKDSGFINVRKKGVCNYYYLTSQDAVDKLLRLNRELQKNSRK